MPEFSSLAYWHSRPFTFLIICSLRALIARVQVCDDNMEACVLVEREQDKVIKKLRTFSGSTATKLQKLIDQVAELKTIFEGRQILLYRCF